MYPMSQCFKRFGFDNRARVRSSNTRAHRRRTYIQSLDEAVPAVAIVGDLDLATSKAVARRLRARCTGLGPGDVLLVDLSRLEFVDVCGAEALAGTAGELRRRGAGIVLRGT